MTITVSFSEVSKFQTCPRQHYYRYILDRVPVDINGPMDTGIKGHRLLQTLYELLRDGYSVAEALKIVQKQANKIMHENNIVDFNLLNAWTLVDNYIRENNFNSNAIIIENRFQIPASMLSNDPALVDVLVGFTPDVVFQRQGDFIDVEDSKFVQKAWSQKKVNRFPQLKLYQIFLERMGYDVSRTVLRFFNVKTGKITAQNYTLGSTEKQTLIDDFMSGVTDVVRYKSLPEFVHKFAPRTMNYNSCQFCQYEYPCSLDAEGKDSTNTLKNLYTGGTYDYNR